MGVGPPLQDLLHEFDEVLITASTAMANVVSSRQAKSMVYFMIIFSDSS